MSLQTICESNRKICKDYKKNLLSLFQQMTSVDSTVFFLRVVITFLANCCIFGRFNVFSPGLTHYFDLSRDSRAWRWIRVSQSFLMHKCVCKILTTRSIEMDTISRTFTFGSFKTISWILLIIFGVVISFGLELHTENLLSFVMFFPIDDSAPRSWMEFTPSILTFN